MRTLVIAAALAGAGACYQPHAGPCQLACSAGTACPDGYTCLGDGYCHAGGEAPTCGDGGPQADGPDAAVASTVVIAAGHRHACAIRDGSLYCWGDNRTMQLGIPATTRRAATPVHVGTATDWIAVDAGLRHTCAVHRGGQVQCWGDGNAQQNGGAIATAVPVTVQTATGPLAGATAVCTGWAHSCALAGGEIYCWGDDSRGQLGDGGGTGGTTARAVRVARPPTTAAWHALTCGSNHTCGIDDHDAVYCWGDAGSGRLGFAAGPTVDAPTTAATTGATAISAGASFTCAVRADGAWCWGTFGSSTAVPATAVMAGASLVSAGDAALCARTGDVTRCLGFGGHGDLGTGTFVGAGALAAAVDGLTGVTALASGDDFHCALVGDAVRCWGKNSDGQLGLGVAATGFAPRQVPGTYTQVSAGRYQTCAVGTDRAVYYWGANSDQHLVPTETAPLVAVPTAVGVADADAVATGTVHQCARRSAGVVCWGDTTYGRVGNGSTAMGLVGPVGVVDDQSRPVVATALAVSDHGSIATRTGAATGLWAWGDNMGYWLGLPALGTYGRAQMVDGAADWTEAALGADFGCALRATTVLCWGNNALGQLGQGDTMPRSLPVSVGSHLYADVAPAAFGAHVCAVGAGAMDAGALYCWGANGDHQVGGTNPFESMPRRFGTDSDWTAVAAGNRTSCGLRGETLQCWGANVDDEYLAGVDGDPLDLTMPTTVGTGFTAVSLGATHGCGIKGGSHELWCWGDSRYGASGLAGAHDHATPQPVVVPPP